MTPLARYTILRKIADGGTAEIFLATQRGAQGFEKPVVLKRIFPAFYADPQFRNMLIDEAHVAMSLNHSNIVQVLDLGEADGQYVMALELVDGWTLDAVLRRANAANLAIPPALALYITAEICRALAYAHAKTGPGGKPLGIVHRDISPHNVLLSEQGEVKLTDFGIAKTESNRDQSLGNTIKGKIAYMSPEQATAAPLDARSDLFSVGTMLYVMICRRYPFDAPTDLEMLLLVKSGEFAPPETARPGLNPEVYRILRRAMARKVDDRYQRADEMLVEVEQVMRLGFRAVGQTELKRWLLELTTRDGVPPLTRDHSPAVGTPPSRADGETLELRGVAASAAPKAAGRSPKTGLRPPPPPAALFVGKKAAPPPLPAASVEAGEEIMLTPLPMPLPEPPPPPGSGPAKAALAAVELAPTRPDMRVPGLEPAAADLPPDGALLPPTLLARLRQPEGRRKAIRLGLAAVALVLVLVSINVLAGKKRAPEPGAGATAAGAKLAATPVAAAARAADTAAAATAAPAPAAAPAPSPEPAAPTPGGPAREGAGTGAAGAAVVAAAAPARATDEPATAPAPPAEEVSPPAEAEAGEGGGEAADTEPSGSADDAERVWISLLVKSTPPGARVELGRKPHGTTPVSVKVRSGTNYVFTFTHEGYRTATRRFKTTDKPGQQLAVTLERASPSKPTAAAGSSTAPSPPKAGDKTDKADKKKSWWQLKFDR